MKNVEDVGGEPLKDSGFENEPVVNDDGVAFLNGNSVIAVPTTPGAVAD